MPDFAPLKSCDFWDVDRLDRLAGSLLRQPSGLKVWATARTCGLAPSIRRTGSPHSFSQSWAVRTLTPKYSAISFHVRREPCCSRCPIKSAKALPAGDNSQSVHSKSNASWYPEYCFHNRPRYVSRIARDYVEYAPALVTGALVFLPRGQDNRERAMVRGPREMSLSLFRAIKCQLWSLTPGVRLTTSLGCWL
jgi:hypothetical protein